MMEQQPVFSPVDQEAAEKYAPLAHEINNVLRAMCGETPQVPWPDFHAKGRLGTVVGLATMIHRIGSGDIEGKPLEEVCGKSHEDWCAYWLGQGYTRGAPGTGRNDVARTHENLVPYADLPQAQKLKDRAFFLIAVAAANEARVMEWDTPDTRPFGGAII